MKTLLILLITLITATTLHSQACTPAGNQTSYGASNTWIGYVYDNSNFTNYSGYVLEGNATSANFDESFSGDYVYYTTNGCPVYTETFSVRYKLTKTFSPGNYQFTVGADDGYRLSIDGGSTWIINHFTDQSYNSSSYSVALNGIYNLVLEYYENAGNNRVSFALTSVCSPTGDPNIYGTTNVWKGYIYQGMNFNTYAGAVTEGTAANPNFDENFGGDNTMYSTGSCPVQTELFSARYRLQKTVATGSYSFTVGADDGYRLSLDGGSTWVINKWNDQGYTTSLYTANLPAGTYNMVLDYYENGGANRVSFAMLTNILLTPGLVNFTGNANTQYVSLNWAVTKEANINYYLVERSVNGIDFGTLGKVNASDDGSDNTYGWVDPSPAAGINYYRLRMVDKDGQFSYPPVIKIMFEDRKAVSIFPSVISNGPVYLKTSAALKNGIVELFDMNGKKLLQTKLPALAAGQTITLSIPERPAGSYVIICKSGDFIKAKQIVIVK